MEDKTATERRLGRGRRRRRSHPKPSPPPTHNIIQPLHPNGSPAHVVPEGSSPQGPHDGQQTAVRIRPLHHQFQPGQVCGVVHVQTRSAPPPPQPQVPSHRRSVVHVHADVVGVGVVHDVGRADGEVVGVAVVEGQRDADVLRGDVGHVLPGRLDAAVQCP